MPHACRRRGRGHRGEVGPIDVLCNIAGGFAMGEAVHETSGETWDFLMGLNAHSVLNMARAVVPRMLARKHGKIVNIGAGAGQHAVAQMGAYSASKSVVIRLTEAMAANSRPRASTSTASCRASSTPREPQGMPNADFGKWVTPAAMAQVVGIPGVGGRRAHSRGGVAGERVELTG
jgi:NAD(P)-dependent dehydrogenase (short-subunit alcohol dehydrogenase family)